MISQDIARLQSAKTILDLIEHEKAKREAYLRGVRRAEIIGRLLPLAISFGSGFLAAQILYFLTF